LHAAAQRRRRSRYRNFSWPRPTLCTGCPTRPVTLLLNVVSQSSVANIAQLGLILKPYLSSTHLLYNEFMSRCTTIDADSTKNCVTCNGTCGTPCTLFFISVYHVCTWFIAQRRLAFNCQLLEKCTTFDNSGTMSEAKTREETIGEPKNINRADFFCFPLRNIL
jgi:hypothetical protein